MKQPGRSVARGVCPTGLLIVLIAGSLAPAGAQERGEGQRGKQGSGEAHYVVSMLELSRRPQLPDREEPAGGDNRVAAPSARPLPPGADIGVPWPPLGDARAISTLSVTSVTQAVSANLSPLPAQMFEGGVDKNTAVAPDTDGAVGPKHVAALLNTGFFVGDRLGTDVMHMSLPTFWAAANHTGTFPFDPKIFYDPLSGRWIASSTAGENSASSVILVGMSVTSDPTGAWVMFSAPVDPAGALAADAPTLGFTKDWVVVSAEMVDLSLGKAISTKIFVFNKSDLINGSSIRFTTFTDPDAFALMPAATYDPTLSTMYLVQDWNGNSGGVGTLRISTITGPVGSETYKATNTFPSSANTWQTCKLSCSLGDFATQLGSTRKIQVADSRVSSVMYQNGSLWVAQNASIPAVAPDHTTAQWWQITLSGVQQFGRVDGGPGTFYAFPTNAVNSNGDMLIGFSSFSSTKYATAGYAFRSATDAPGTLRNVVEYKPGENFYYKIDLARDNRNRWGDYSSTVIDPNGLDMWTLQEYAASPDIIENGVSYSRWGTYWARVSPSSNVVIPQSGWWWDPNLNGTGFFIEYGGKSGTGMFIGGFLYDASGNSAWLASTGPMSGTTYASSWLKVTGGQTLTGPYKAPGSTTVANLALQFTDATHAVMTRPDGTQVPLQRFAFSVSTPSAPIPGAPQSGWWWAGSSLSGSGYGIEIQGSSVFIVAYVYDNAGNPVWYLATGSLTTPTSYSGTWQLYAGGPQLTSPEGNYKGTPVPGSDVVMSLSFSDATHGTLTMGNVSIAILRFQEF